ncbi:MAG: hypothetical protein QME94_07875, partial [Anaerolineae bacterium]|nr:hypothetical protein [Anaerolineae bacterium]
MSKVASLIGGARARLGWRGESKEARKERFYRAGQWQLVWWRFRRHKLAQTAAVVLSAFYIVAAFAEFLSPHDPQYRYKQFTACPPTAVHVRDLDGNWRAPFIYQMVRTRDPDTMRPIYKADAGVTA